MRRRNDEGADFSELYRKTSPDVLAFLLRRCPTAEDAADGLAETFLVAWEKRDQIPADGEARPWLFAVARNVMRRGHERRGRAASAARALASELETSAAAAREPTLSVPDPVLVAIATLPAIDQEIITMIAWDGLTPREVASVLGISPNAVRVRAHRARARIKAALTSGDTDLYCPPPEPLTAQTSKSA
jgi:RNA polymerase sigma factor (sigma-70 family)